MQKRMNYASVNLISDFFGSRHNQREKERKRERKTDRQKDRKEGRGKGRQGGCEAKWHEPMRSADLVRTDWLVAGAPYQSLDLRWWVVGRTQPMGIVVIEMNLAWFTLVGHQVDNQIWFMCRPDRKRRPVLQTSIYTDAFLIWLSFPIFNWCLLSRCRVRRRIKTTTRA